MPSVPGPAAPRPPALARWATAVLAEGRVLVSARGPFAVGSVLWRDSRGQLLCTVVAKATYELAPGESPPVDPHQTLQVEDAYPEQDRARGVSIPSDLAPFKRAAEVVVVGSAFAAKPVASIVARVIVGCVDKSVEAFPPRYIRQDGVIEAGSLATRFPLGYEHAAGGPGTANPAGIDTGTADRQGRFQIPRILPPFQPVAAPGAYLPTACFGPIAAAWPSRATLLGAVEQGWLRVADEVALPASLPSQYFQCAPQDQWLDRPLAANERIVLEGLHPDVGRLAMSLSGLQPHAVLARPTPESLRLVGDLLVVDTDRGLCTLTFRASFPVEEGTGPLRVVVVGVQGGMDLTPEEVRRHASHDNEPFETTHTGAIVLDPAQPGSTDLRIERTSRPVLPFTPAPDHGDLTPKPRAPDAALPFRAADPSASGDRRIADPSASALLRLSEPAAARPAEGVPAPTFDKVPRALRAPPPTPSAPSLPSTATPPPPPSAPSSLPPPLRVPAPSLSGAAPPPAPPAPIHVPPARVSSPSLSGAAPISLSTSATPASEPFSYDGAASGPKPRAPAEPSRDPVAFGPKVSAEPAPPVPAARRSGAGLVSFDAAFGGARSGPEGEGAARRPGPGAASFDTAFGGARAASDAAARATPAAPAREDAPRERVTPARTAPEASGRREAVVSLVCFDPAIAPRLRTGKRFAAALAPKARPKRPQGMDEPLKEAVPDDRTDVLRVLSFGQPEDAAEIRRALRDSLDDAEDLEPPLLLVAGELRPTFDEVEVLRATIAVTQPVAGGDKKVLSAIAVGQEALAAPVAPRAETTVKLSKQIEQTASSLSLPPRWVPSEVERVVVEGRKYKRRTLLGAARLRADLVLARSGEAVPIYLPESAASSLPLLPAFPVVALCIVTTREDLTETQPEALVATALGRVLSHR